MKYVRISRLYGAGCAAFSLRRAGSLGGPKSMSRTVLMRPVRMLALADNCFDFPKSE
ncbi:hypothetical protein ACE3MS_11350 [Paenibacillus dendritiformis]|uniref:hypothetical protein n=1 Tax=Paenibacillus dendritiformis TaxID=130049 RepID=UPI00365CBBD2